MSRGTPDWANRRKDTLHTNLSDMAELAVRLGSPVAYDRRGDVVWYDDFENGVSRWSELGSGTGHALAADTTYSLRGAASALLTAGSDGLQNGLMRFAITSTVSDRMGVAEAIALGDNIAQHWLFFEYLDGANRYEWAILYDHLVNTLSYQDSTGTFIAFASGVILRDTKGGWAEAKLVCDLVAHTYVRFQLGAVEYSLDGLGVFNAPSAAAPRTMISVQIQGDALAIATLYVDDVILTANEP